MSQQPSLQRSKSAPYTVSALAEPARSSEVDEEKPAVLARTVSHEHMHGKRLQRQQQLKPKPLWHPTSPPEDEEDPFNLLTFFPPAGGLSRRRSGWQSWLRGEEAGLEEEEENVIVVVGDEDDGIEESPTIFTPVEDHEALKGSAKVGAVSYEDDGLLLSPYRLEDAVDEESLFEHFRRRRAEIEK